MRCALIAATFIVAILTRFNAYMSCSDSEDIQSSLASTNLIVATLTNAIFAGLNTSTSSNAQSSLVRTNYTASYDHLGGIATAGSVEPTHTSNNLKLIETRIVTSEVIQATSFTAGCRVYSRPNCASRSHYTDPGYGEFILKLVEEHR